MRLQGTISTHIFSKRQHILTTLDRLTWLTWRQLVQLTWQTRQQVSKMLMERYLEPCFIQWIRYYWNLLDANRLFYKFLLGNLDLAYYVSPDIPESVFISAAVVMVMIAIFAWTTNICVIVAYMRNSHVSPNIIICTKFFTGREM